MVLGLSSIVAGFVEPYLSVGTLVINVSGQSSTGKSTITELAGSFYGSPVIGESGMVRTFNSTKNALLAASENKYGLPILLDDINANRTEHSKMDLVYQFALNESRMRCDGSGNLLPHRGSWSGIVLITSESPMFDNEVVTQGVEARCLNLDNIVWTQDAAHSNRIKSGVRTDYGFLALEFANLVESLGENTILSMHADATKTVYDMMINPNRLSQRVALKLASIYVTAQLVERFIGCGTFNIDDVMELLINAERDSRDTQSIEEKALDLLKDFAVSNKGRFAVYAEEVTRIPNTGLLGAITINGNDCHLNILKPAFKEFLRQNNITERLTILRAWAFQDVIEYEEGHGYDTHVSALSGRRAIRVKITRDEARFFLPELYSEIRMPEIDVTPSIIRDITYEEPDDPFGDDLGGNNEDNNQ